MCPWMLATFVALAAQGLTPFSHELLGIEDARPADLAPLIEATEHRDATVRRQTVRALGRTERMSLQSTLLEAMEDPDERVRVEAANALAQVNATVDYATLLEKERAGAVRAVLFEALGRSEHVDESLLRRGLSEAEPARRGAAKAFEHWLRVSSPTLAPQTLQSLRQAATDPDASPVVRRLALAALNHVDGADPETLRRAVNDRDEQVRRLAVIGGKLWVDDASYLVRIEALRQAFTCERGVSALLDANQHVVLLAIDLMTECEAAPLRALVKDSSAWRTGAHALVTLSKTEPATARAALPAYQQHSSWQARAYAARAAVKLGETKVLEILRQDAHPNVVAETITSRETALAVLPHQDYGLVMRALEQLEDASESLGGTDTMKLFTTLEQLTKHQRHTSRDPRRLILDRLEEAGSREHLLQLRPWLSDFDPAIAHRVAEILSKVESKPVEHLTKAFEPAPLPPIERLNRLRDAHAVIRMRGLGAITLELFADEAPLTVAQFARLSELGYYTGLTFHRIVPNFVLQGGSPGANEYVGTDTYIRDEVGLRSHERGTLGISTRGRDTGDSQIFINLVDNYRLDHNYTVFARVRSGIDVVDRIQEGDVIDSITVVHR